MLTGAGAGTGTSTPAPARPCVPTPAQIIFNMGFATNAFGIPAVGGRGTLLVSDSLNHSSIVTGARASGASVQVYKHNDYRGLESLVRRGRGAGQREAVRAAARDARTRA